MTVSEIIKQVKWCIDHETTSRAYLADGGEDTYMDNIIRAKINDALHWVAVVSAQAAALGDSSKAVTGNSSTIRLAVRQYTEVGGVTDVGIVEVPSGIETAGVGRVKVKGWHKAVVPIADTDDEAAMMFDDTAKGTADRPQAAIMQGNPIRLLVQPYDRSTEVEVTYVGVPKEVDTTSDSTDVQIPAMLRNAVIYYIAFLLLSAYQDAGAQTMYVIALQHLGINQQK